jgi:hypothetical protein
MGLLGTGPRATPLRVAPGKARGHVVSSRDEAQHAAGPAADHVTEFDGYPPSAAGVLASARARPILLGASGPFDGSGPRAPAPWRAAGVSWSLDAFGAPGGFRSSADNCPDRRRCYFTRFLPWTTTELRTRPPPLHADGSLAACVQTRAGARRPRRPKAADAENGDVSCRSRAASPLGPCSPQSWS